jgi:hypothetical protein
VLDNLIFRLLQRFLAPREILLAVLQPPSGRFVIETLLFERRGAALQLVAADGQIGLRAGSVGLPIDAFQRQGMLVLFECAQLLLQQQPLRIDGRTLLFEFRPRLRK